MLLNTRPKKIVVLTGAGISAESGLKTFRDANGLWEDHDVTEVATPQAFERDPELVHRFYNLRRKQLLSSEVSPNPAHFALSKLQREFEGEVVVITQNIDDLHERSGTHDVIHMHGELLKMRCNRTKRLYDIFSDISPKSLCQCCQIPGNLRPHIVWFGEVPFHMEEIYAHLSQTSLFLAVGTSGHVYPAAMFVELAELAGAHCIEVNLEDTNVSEKFKEHYVGKAGIQLPKLVDAILAL